jgi:hypothetical protein
VGFIGGFDDFNAAFVAGLEGAFTASARVDLGLNDEDVCAGGDELFGGRADFVRGGADSAIRNSDTVLLQQLLGLKLVNVHNVKLR